MAQFALFLRGINVGKIRVPMPELKTVLEGLGCSGVQTWLATGNVVLTSALAEPDLKHEVQRALSESFSYDAYVLMRDPQNLGEIISGYPFADSEQHHRYVVLCEPNIGQQVLALLDDAGGPGTSEQVALANTGDIYWQCPKGSSTKSSVARVLTRASVKKGATTRNLNTIEKMVAALG